MLISLMTISCTSISRFVDGNPTWQNIAASFYQANCKLKLYTGRTACLDDDVDTNVAKDSLDVGFSVLRRLQRCDPLLISQRALVGLPPKSSTVTSAGEEIPSGQPKQKFR